MKPSQDDTLTFGSLFAGIGGFDLGLERAGMVCRWQVEIDPFCQKVLAKHWPEVKRYADITKLIETELEPVDLICGGFPCQPFSSASAGKRTGVADDRFLWPEMLRVAEAVRSTWIVAENVTHIDGLALEQVVSDMEARGYEVAAPLEVPACAFGHDHRRPRLWFIGYSDRNRKSKLSVDATLAGVQRTVGRSDVLGKPNGVSGRMDRHRLRSLGNAVVPDIAEWIGRAILKTAIDCKDKANTTDETIPG